MVEAPAASRQAQRANVKRILFIITFLPTNATRRIVLGQKSLGDFPSRVSGQAELVWRWKDLIQEDASLREPSRIPQVAIKTLDHGLACSGRSSKDLASL